MIKAIAGAALVLLAVPVAAQEPAPFAPDCTAIATFLDRAVTEGRTVGATALVWKDGGERCFATAGDADREAARPIARDTLFQIYSMTKPVTGVALMQLWEAGKVRLDDPLAKYLPEYATMRVYAGKDEAGQHVRPSSNGR